MGKSWGRLSKYISARRLFVFVTFGTNWSIDKRGMVVINATQGLFSIDKEAKSERVCA